MKTADFLYLALIAVLLLRDHFVTWPAFLRRSQDDPGRARLWVWSNAIIMLWTLAAGGIALWLFEARAWDSLRFVAPRGWRLWVAIGLALAVAVASAKSALRIVRTRRTKRIKVGHTHAERFSPHTRTELVWWLAVSLSAGFCEEFIFRGYLIWAFRPVLGLWGAAAFSVVLFASAHAYQGARSAFAVGVVGGLLTLVVLVLGSLWPAIALHALLDIGQGVVAWLAFRKVRGEGDPEAGLASPRPVEA